MGLNSQKVSASVLCSQLASPWLCLPGQSQFGASERRNATPASSNHVELRIKEIMGLPFCPSAVCTQALPATLPVGKRETSDADHELCRT